MAWEISTYRRVLKVEKIDVYRGETLTWNRRILDADESTNLMNREISTLNWRAFNVKKSTYTVGEASSWNWRTFDVDESTGLMDREISTLNRRWNDVLKCTMSSQILFDVESTSIRRKKNNFTNHGVNVDVEFTWIRQWKVSVHLWPFCNGESTSIQRRIFNVDLVDVHYVYSMCFPRCRFHRVRSTLFIWALACMKRPWLSFTTVHPQTLLPPKIGIIAGMRESLSSGEVTKFFKEFLYWALIGKGVCLWWNVA